MPLHGRHHEQQSCDLFDFICDNYDIRLSPEERGRVKDLIGPGKEVEGWQPQVGGQGSLCSSPMKHLTPIKHLGV